MPVTNSAIECANAWDSDGENINLLQEITQSVDHAIESGEWVLALAFDKQRYETLTELPPSFFRLATGHTRQALEEILVATNKQRAVAEAALATVEGEKHTFRKKKQAVGRYQRTMNI